LAIRGARATQICRQKADNINSFVLKFKAEGESGRAAEARLVFAFVENNNDLQKAYTAAEPDGCRFPGQPARRSEEGTG